jgi:hypothetical protein
MRLMILAATPYIFVQTHYEQEGRDGVERVMTKSARVPLKGIGRVAVVNIQNRLLPPYEA